MDLSEEWYKDAVIYSLDVETFVDSDGNGVGDFQGLISRLGYLSRLGVDCLWLLPFYPTPNRDNGYDVTDYYGVDPRLGTLGDFVDFIHQAEDRGIRVLIDLVVNHTSNEHPWFERARKNPDSPYRDYYVWCDDPAEAPQRRPVFPGEEENVWTYDEVADAYYYHRFYHFQPELNVANPDVREEIRKIMNYWLELGVDGFRVDAVTLMLDQKGIDPHPLADPHDILRELKTFARNRHPDAVLLAEADDTPDRLDDYFGDCDQMDLLLNFVLNAYTAHALASGQAAAIADGLDRLPAIPDCGAWANFLRNFDELNIARLHEEGREEVYEAFAPETSMRIYERGIRRRLAPMLDGDQRRIELAYSLLFSLPGAPILVAGDEIGMGDDISLPGRNTVRTPMHWANEPNAGFSTASPDELVRPVIDEGPFSYKHVNVADQRSDPRALLNRMEALIQTRKEYPELSRGTHTVLETGHPNVFAHASEWNENTVVAVHNLADDSASVELDLADEADRGVAKLVGEAEFAIDDDADSCVVELDPYNYCWLQITSARHRVPRPSS